MKIDEEIFYSLNKKYFKLIEVILLIVGLFLNPLFYMCFFNVIEPFLSLFGIILPELTYIHYFFISPIFLFFSSLLNRKKYDTEYERFLDMLSMWFSSILNKSISLIVISILNFIVF